MARKLINTKEISYEEWLKLRKRSIGGSDSASCVGMNQYQSSIALYAEKKGLSKPFEGNGATKLGTFLEDFVAREYMERTGKKVRNDNYMYMDDEYDFLTANVDRVIVGENAALECKTMGSFGKYDLEAGEIPAHYYCQCQHYMMIMGYEYMDLCIYVLQKDIYINRINRNEDFIKELRAAEIDFWQNHVEKSEAPEPDGTESSIEAVKELYSESVSQSEIYIPQVDEMIERHKELSRRIKDLEEEKMQIQAVICSKLGIGGVGVGEKYGCSWKTQSRSSLDSKKLKNDLPDIYARYTSMTEYPVFRIKKLKEA